MENRRLSQFDFLRIVFCITVVLFHMYCFVPIPDSVILGFVSKYGYLGVEMFFMLSGFCVSMRYKSRMRDLGIKNFMVGRLRKIYPLTAFSIIVGFCLLYPYAKLECGGGIKPLSFDYLLSSILLIQNGWLVEFGFNAYGSGTWFIEVLILVYLLWAIIAKKTYNKQGRYTALCLGMVIIGFSFFYRSYDVPFLSHLSCRGYMSFFIGCLLFELFNIVDGKTGRKIAFWYNIISLVVIVFCIMDNSLIGNLYVFFSFIVFPSIILLFVYNPVIVRFLNKESFSKAAKYTMSVYLTHALVLYAVKIIDAVLGAKINFEKWTIYISLLVVIVATGVAIQHCFDVISRVIQGNRQRDR